MKSRAALLETPNSRFIVDTVEIEEPRPDELLVRIEAVGICHTDLVFASGALDTPFPVILGHEGAGVVEQVGAEVTGLSPGDKVLLTFDSCGGCAQCGDHLPGYCQEFTAINYACTRADGSSPASRDGAQIAARFFGQSSFSRYAIVRARNAVKLPGDADLAMLAPLGCSIQTGVGGVLNALAAPAGSGLVVIGAGSVGLAAILGGRLADCGKIIAIEPHAERRALARDLGADEAIDPADGDMAAAVREIAPDGVDNVFDTSGVVEALSAALDMLKPNGTLGLVGVPGSLDAVLPLPIAQAITFGLGVKGIIEGDSDPQTFLPKLARLYTEGKLPFDRFVTHYPFDRINDAIEDAHAGKCVKPVLVMEDG